MSMSQVGSGLPRLLAERYELVEQLASGSMTSVWRGHDRVLGRDVVVKVLHPDLAADAGLRGSFHQEAINAARLTHPNIVALYDTGEQEGVNYIVMELVDGPTLRDVLSSHGPLPPAKAARLASEVVHALDYAHQAGVLHRNLKPGNILFCDDGSVKVADFSIVKAASGDDPGRTGELLAAGGYIAPEAADGGDPDGRADVFGLGACMFEMLTGRPPGTVPSRGNNGPLSPRAIRAGVPRELDAVVLKAMMLDPRDRYPTAAAMGAALARAAAWAAPAQRGRARPGLPAARGPLARLDPGGRRPSRRAGGGRREPQRQRPDQPPRHPPDTGQDVTQDHITAGRGAPDRRGAGLRPLRQPADGERRASGQGDRPRSPDGMGDGALQLGGLRQAQAGPGDGARPRQPAEGAPARPPAAQWRIRYRGLWIELGADQLRRVDHAQARHQL